ncbi:MAG: lysine--tRNA ligase [Deltaproteobacteria bacterium]|nr:MAG: lysine--tRNA ligase [Deltaproteobacteria bacterium]
MSANEQSPKGESTLRRIVDERRAKAAELRAAGRDPYGNRFRPTATCAEVRARYADTRPAEPPAGKGIVPVDGHVFRLAGRVIAKRGFGKTVFAPIRDGSGDLQLFLNVEHIPADQFEQVVKRIDVGDIVGAEGAVFWTKRGEMSLLVTSVEIVTKALRPPPEKWHGLQDVELRYRQRYLDLAVNPDVREVFRKRSRIVKSVRDFLTERGFLEVETPMMHPIIGGAAARPFVTHHNALDMTLYLRIAPELYLKRLLVGGFERVFEINRNFRNEGIDRQHNPEFTMLEFYQAYATYEDLMGFTEDLITTVAREVNGGLRTRWWDHDIDLSPPWPRLSVRDAVVDRAGRPAAVFDDPVVAAIAAAAAGVPVADIYRVLLESVDPADAPAIPAGATTLDESLVRAIADRYADPLDRRVRAGHLAYKIFEQTVEDTLIQPTFVTDFPLAVSPLARKKDADPAFVDRFELMIGGAEIANAFSELNDPDDQRARFIAQLRARAHGAEETMDCDEDYCRALEVGMPPAAGEGIGIDRLVMLLTGQPSIRDVLLFPLMRPE